MTLRLLRDALWRSRWQIVLPLLAFAQFWSGVAVGVFGANVLMAVSMAIAAGVTLAAPETVAPREVRLLPVSRRQIWRAAWWLSVVATPVFLAAAKMGGVITAGLLTSQQWSFEMVMLSGLLDLAYAGLMSAVLPAASRLRTVTARSGDSDRLAGWLVSTVLSLGFLLPALFYRYLPADWSAVSTGTIVFLAAGFTAAIFSYAAPPRVLPALTARVGKAAVNRQLRAINWPEWPSITGLPRLLIKYWGTGLLIQASTLVLIPGVMVPVFLAVFDVGMTWSSQIEELGFLPFTGRGPGSAMPLMWFVATVPNDGVSRMLRHLRTVFTVRQMVWLLLAIAAGSWLIVAFLFAAFHLIITDIPLGTAQLPYLVFLIGAGALFQSMHMRFPNAGMFLLFLVGMVFVEITTRPVASSRDLVYVTLGALGLLLAAGINHSTLTHKREVYSFRVRTLTSSELPE